MTYHPDIHHRQSIRLRGHDYTQAGCYFITIGTAQKLPLLGKVVDGVMVLNAAGEIVRQCWHDIPQHFPSVGAKDFLPLQSNVPQPLHGTSRTVGSIVRGFKVGVTKWFRANTDCHVVWQRNYYERIVRNDAELGNIREYIRNNPLQWTLDELFVP